MLFVSKLSFCIEYFIEIYLPSKYSFKIRFYNDLIFNVIL